ncbi:MAG: 50S ribosomal protein L6 [Candidatus ainarchaeum sp.]|nr:50S ribosomal protein L6 [Candidatus ainarchaeum sp.]
MEIPSGITITIEGTLVKARGPKGEAQKLLTVRNVAIRSDGKTVTVECADHVMKSTVEAHLRNLVKGVQQGYSRKMKMIYAHFPFTLEVKGDTLTVKNMLGEKLPRRLKIIGKTKIEVKGQEVTVSGPSKDDVGQTIANMKTALKIRNKDPRVFQDGIYEIA